MRTTLSVLIAGCAILLIASCGDGKKKEPPAFYEPEKVELDIEEEKVTESSSSNDIELQTSNEQDAGSSTSESPLSSGEIIQIPFLERNGVKYVEAKINNAIDVDMILDSGCSGATISVTEATYLYKRGAISEKDIVGPVASELANGSIEVNAQIILREICLGGKIKSKDVKATVISNPQASLLLGNDVLDRVSSYEVDNVNKVIKFKIQ